MLKDNIHDIYLKLKLYYYRRIFRKIHSDEKDALTAIESFCAEAIYGLGYPTLGQFAEFINVSQPNAAYKIANLEKKGFVRKVKSEEDGRIVHLQVTEKFLDIYGSSERYAAILRKRIERRFPPEDVEKLNEILSVVSGELMKEINVYLAKTTPLPPAEGQAVPPEEKAGGL